MRPYRTPIGKLRTADGLFYEGALPPVFNAGSGVQEPAILGSFHYRGKTTEGDWPPVAFSARKQKLVLYLHCELDKQAALLGKLGKHKIGKSCLYLKKLEDAHLPTLKKLIMKAYKSPAIAGATIT